MDRNHKKKPEISSTPSSSNGGTGSHDIPSFTAPKTFERRVSADAATVFSTINQNSALPPKMSLASYSKAKSPEPIISEPDSPLPIMKTRFGSTDLINNNGRSHTSSPFTERRSHQTSTQSVTVQQHRQYQEIVDGPGGRQVVNYSTARQNSQSKESQIHATEINGELKVDADHKISSSSAAKASIEALDSMGESLRAACAALTHSSNVTRSEFTGSNSGIGELTQQTKTETKGMRAVQNPDGSMHGVTFSNSDGGNNNVQNQSVSSLMDRLNRETPSIMGNQVRSTLQQMAALMDQQATLTPMLKSKLSDDGVMDLLIENVDSEDMEVSMLSAKVLDKCMNTEARERLLKRGLDGIVRVRS